MKRLTVNDLLPTPDATPVADYADLPALATDEIKESVLQKLELEAADLEALTDGFSPEEAHAVTETLMKRFNIQKNDLRQGSLPYLLWKKKILTKDEAGWLAGERE